MSNLCQVILCPVEKHAFAAAIEPYCYTDKVWLADLKKYVEKGCVVEMRDPKSFSMEKCECDWSKKEVKPQFELF